MLDGTDRPLARYRFGRRVNQQPVGVLLLAAGFSVQLICLVHQNADHAAGAMRTHLELGCTSR
jgi:hypothetical protein